jgi:rubrerythrin
MQFTLIRRANKFKYMGLFSTIMKFECKKCRYQTDKPSLPSRCPYCGEAGTMRKASTAQDLINDIFDEPEDLQSK